MSSSSTIRIRGITVSRPLVLADGNVAGFRFVGWQSQPDAGSPVGVGIRRAVHLNVAIVLFNDAVHQRQAKAGSLTGGLGGVKRFEDVIELIPGDAGAFINHLDNSG